MQYVPPIEEPQSGISPKPVLPRLLPSLGIMVVLLVVGLWALLWQQNQKQLAEKLSAQIATVNRELYVDLANLAEGMSATSQAIATDPGVRKCLRSGNAEQLRATWLPVFETLRRENGFTHFKFLNAKRTTLIRLHKPELRGDLDNHVAVLEAERTGKIASGLELGQTGNFDGRISFTLRVVRPVFDDGELVGFLVLGKEIEEVLRARRTQPELEIAVTVQKRQVNRQWWEEGMARIGRKADWDKLPNTMILYASQPDFPNALVQWAKQSAGNHEHGETDRELAFDGQTWRVAIMPLLNPSSEDVGSLLIMRNITADKAAFARVLLRSGSAGAVLIALLLGIIYVLLRRTDAGILSQQASLLESEARMRAIADSAQDAIIMMDPGGVVSYWNPAAYRIFGHTHDEAMGKNLHDLIVPLHYHPAHHAAFAVYKHTGKGSAIGTTLELEGTHKNGHEFGVEMSLSGLHLHDGWHTVGIIRDITERKRGEAELQQVNRGLEKATALANDMAVQAELSNIAKGEFLANMSHELRTPMNGVIGMTELLLDTQLDKEQRIYAETVSKSAESLLALLNDILDFSKIEAGKVELEELDFDLREVLEEFAATLALRAQEKGIEFICAASPTIPNDLRGDPGRLRQVLLNLTGNALKFTKTGEVAVRAALESESDQEAVIRFSVKDTGIGIPVDKQEMLFQKFTQVDASTTRQYGGTGLGLAISKQLVELMGGQIGIESGEGRGSEFWFTSRFAKQPKRERTLPVLAGIAGSHILIVDDNATNREVLMIQLRSWGVRAQACEDGISALRLLRQAKSEGDPFHLAVLDMQMPGIDGTTLGNAIKADESLRETHLMLMTSMGKQGDTKQMEEIGFAAYLAKPARQSDLFNCLSAVLGTAVEDQSKHPIVTRHSVRVFHQGAGRILLAEDNITNQQVAKAILKKLGLRADVVADGAEAVEALTNRPYDLVFMDVQMPEMDGFQATRRIRDPQSGVRNHQIPIIAMTARVMQRDREACLEAGMNDYLSKPVSADALRQALERWLPRKAEETLEQFAGNLGEATPVNVDLPAFNIDDLMSRLMHDDELAVKLAEYFLEDLPVQIRTLEANLLAGDATAVRFRAHAIRGASANMGGEALRVVATEIEQYGMDGDLKSARERMPELRMQFDRLKEAMSVRFQFPG